MPGFKAKPPARKPWESSGKSVSDSRRSARDGIGKKMVAVAPVELSKPDPRLLLGKRLRDEMEALRGLVKKAELLARKNANGRRRSMETETRRPDTTEEGEKTPCAKKRKTMPAAKIVEPMTMLGNHANHGAAPRHAREGRRSLETGARQEQKRRKTMPPVAIVEPRTPKRETGSLARCVSSLSPKMPRRDEKEEAANVSRSPISSGPSARQVEEGEIVEEEDGHVFVDICGGVSPAPAVHPPPLLLLEDNKTEEENVLVDTCGEASPSPVAAQKIAEAQNSPSSSSSSSGSSCSDSSDSESSRSSDSDNSDSDDDDTESVGSSPAPDIPHKVDTPPVVAAHKVVRSSPVAAEQFVDESADDDQSVGSSPFPSFLPKRVEKPAKPVERRQAEAQSEKSVPAPAPQMSHLLARARTRMRQLRREPERQKAYDELEAMERNALPSDWIRPMDLIEFGITAVEHLVTFERFVPGCGGPLQQWFGLSWKGE